MTDDSPTNLIRKANAFWGWLYANAKVLIACGCTAGGAIIGGAVGMGGARQQTRDIAAGQERIEETLKQVVGTVGVLAQSSAANTAHLEDISHRMEAQERWRERVEDVAEVRVTRRKK